MQKIVRLVFFCILIYLFSACTNSPAAYRQSVPNNADLNPKPADTVVRADAKPIEPMPDVTATPPNETQNPVATTQPPTPKEVKTAATHTNPTPTHAQPEPKTDNTSGNRNTGEISFPWLTNYNAANAITNRISPPDGFERIAVAENSFAYWLRQLPLKDGKPPVLLYNGSQKGNQNAHYAVLNIDVGKEDLQQCADAVMRLRAEYLYNQQNYDAIHFNYTSGHKAAYSQWRQGYRPVVSGNKVSWVQRESAANSTSYASFKQYLKQVFTYAGSLSLSKEMTAVGNTQNIAAGNVFIQGGSPGHAVMVLDVAQNSQGEKVFLLAQSYMPAQEVHVLVNPDNANLSPWYSANIGAQLQTPEWTFTPQDLKKFK